jgi:hypothetical protein
MHRLLLAKLSFWLIIIGVFALIAPNPAWPPLLAKVVLGAGVLLAAGALIAAALKGRGADSKGPGRRV